MGKCDPSKLCPPWGLLFPSPLLPRHSVTDYRCALWDGGVERRGVLVVGAVLRELSALLWVGVALKDFAVWTGNTYSRYCMSTCVRVSVDMLCILEIWIYSLRLCRCKDDGESFRLPRSACLLLLLWNAFAGYTYVSGISMLRGVEADRGKGPLKPVRSSFFDLGWRSPCAAAAAFPSLMASRQRESSRTMWWCAPMKAFPTRRMTFYASGILVGRLNGASRTNYGLGLLEGV